MTDYVPIDIVEIIATTDRAVLVLTEDGEELWIPRS